MSSCNWPRATVPSTDGRSERWSAKKSLRESGFCRGCTCISRRQPVSKAITASAHTREIWRRRSMLARHLRHRAWVQCLQEIARARGIIFFVGGKHDQEEAVFRGQRKTRNVENRVIGHGQAIQREHAEDGGDSSKQNRHLKRDNDERGPRMIGLAPDVERIVDGGHPVLH